MLRWKYRYLPLLVSLALMLVALANAGLFRFFNLEW
jgi:hypothetical protein